jgi:CBS domain-containing protein
MARYDRDYGRDFGRWRQSGPPLSGGMRSDGWGGSGDWKQFPGEEGWFGEGYEVMPGGGYDTGFRGADRSIGRSGGFGGGPGRYGQGPGFQGSYGGDYRSRGLGQGYGSRWDTGRGGRDLGYSEGWDDSLDRGRQRTTMGGRGARGAMRALEIMTENPQVVTPEATIAEVAQKMRDLDVGIIPVVDNVEGRQLRGVITDRDIAIRAVAEGKDGKVRVSDCMTADVRTVNKNDSVRDVMRVMRQDQVRRVPVTDREGRLVGIIAQADLAVDYALDDPSREAELGETIERISEPAQPQRRGVFAAASGQQSDRLSNPEREASADQSGRTRPTGNR